MAIIKQNGHRDISVAVTTIQHKRKRPQAECTVAATYKIVRLWLEQQAHSDKGNGTKNHIAQFHWIHLGKKEIISDLRRKSITSFREMSIGNF
jgi:hypothetical protein